MKKKAYLGIDIGSISTKGVIINEKNEFLAECYLWTEGNPTQATQKVLRELEKQFDADAYRIAASGTTGSARKLVGSMIGAQVIKNEITAHAVGTTTLHPDVRTLLEIGGQDSKIICVENGVAVDYAMNTLCAAGTGAFLSSQAHRLGVEVEEFGEIALKAKKAAPIAIRCTVFAESDLVHKQQLGMPVLVDEKGHLMGAFGIAILAKERQDEGEFSFDVAEMEFKTREITCGKCANHCEIICVYRDGMLIDSWGNRCDNGAVRQ